MASYRIYYCDARGKVFSADDFNAAADASAVERAKSMAGRRSKIFEVWHRDRLVYRNPKIDLTVTGDRPARLGLLPAPGADDGDAES